MKKQRKILAQVLIFMTIVLSSCQVFATDISSSVKKIEFSEAYKKYLELTDEEKQNVIAPRMYDIPKTKTKTTVTNPLRLARMARSTSDSSFSLRNIIPENMVIKDQMETNSCWTFSSLAALESNLALKDYKNGITTPIVYDFSERHMEYATSQSFLDNVKNPIGFNRNVGAGGSPILSIPYLTNGTGAIVEAEMPFENNEDSIYITEIQNKNVVTQVNDVLTFPAYLETDDKTEIIKQMKEFIKNYGAIDACIHGASFFGSDSPVYNNETGAIYCNSSETYMIDHAIAIIGWDDNYSKDNFVEGNRPSQNGAWIIKNSWGTGIKYTLEEMKEIMFENAKEECIQNGYTEASLIPDEVVKNAFIERGYTINENNEAVLKVGNDGFMYVSYEDANIYMQMTGIQDSQNEITYENIYQYDEYGAIYANTFMGPKIYLATEFDKKTSGVEYITQVSIRTAEPGTYKVYVNPNNLSKKLTDLQQVQLKTGEIETFNDVGYHTIEFAEPIKINGDKFVVVLEVEGATKETVTIMAEVNYGELVGQDDGTIFQALNNVEVSGRCFVATEEEVALNQWTNTGMFFEVTQGNLPNCDTTIKAFTTSKVLENIQVTTPPNKTTYVIGQDFDKTGMVVKANYGNGDSIEINDYTIQNGTKLAANQTSITITYQNKTVELPINVVENKVEKIEISTAPTNTEYTAGDDFDTTGMIIEAIYTDGTKKAVTEYNVTDGQPLKNGQTMVTIEFEGKTVTQQVVVNPNPIVKLEIVSDATKLNYVEGQNFDTTGLTIKATYENGKEREIASYTVVDGTDLEIGQTTVSIKFEDHTVTQTITVIEKAITEITVKTMPAKTQYIQNKEELDLTGGIIEVSYNDGEKEEVLMTSEEVTVSGFDNKKPGKKTITLTYEEKTTQFDIEIIELPKPQNSNFENMQGKINSIRAYSYTDQNKKAYVKLNIELKDIVKATENETMEYHYYLSPNPNEENISDWVKIDKLQQTDGGFTFEINTLDITNYEELVEANSIYLYVKEIATRNEMKSEKITLSVILSVENIKIEEYVDDEKKATTNPGANTGTTPAEKEDNTKAPGSIPKAGKDVLIIFLAIAIIIIGKIAYSKYKDIQIK